MALTVTEQQTVLQFNSNLIGKMYNFTCDNNYQNGYTIDENVYPNNTNPFTKILAVIPINDIIVDAYVPKYTLNNTDTTDPEILLEIEEFVTGGGAPAEVINGTDLTGLIFKALVLGIPSDGVICDPC